MNELPLIYFLIRPKYWPELIFMGFAWLVAKLPVSWQVKLAKLLAKLLLKYAHKRRKVTEINLQLCFPEKSENERLALLKRNFEMTALAIIETAACWFSDLKSRDKTMRLKGEEHIQAALDKGNGAILLFFHFTSMELGGCLLGHHYDFKAMYKPNKNRLIERMMRVGRLRHVKGLFSQNDAKATLKALKNNEIVWYANDQNFGNKKGLFVPFFNIQASTVPAISKFARMTGASVIPFTHKRSDDLESLELEIHPPLENFPSDSMEDDAIRINQFLESFLRENPENYMWLHQRFRTRPPGEPPIYPPKKPV